MNGVCSVIILCVGFLYFLWGTDFYWNEERALQQFGNMAEFYFFGSFVLFFIIIGIINLIFLSETAAIFSVGAMIVMIILIVITYVNHHYGDMTGIEKGVVSIFGGAIILFVFALTALPGFGMALLVINKNKFKK